MEFGFSQSYSHVVVEDDDHELARPLKMVCDAAPLLASAGKVMRLSIENEMGMI